MKASLEDQTFFPDRLTAAVERITIDLGISDDRTQLLEVRDLIRTTYCAANNARAVAQDTAFAYKILQAVCNTAQVELIRRLASIHDLLPVAMHLHLEGKNIIREVVEDLMVD